MRGMEVAGRRLAELLLSECGDVPRKNALALGAIISGSALGAMLLPSGAGAFNSHGWKVVVSCQWGDKLIYCDDTLKPPEICCIYPQGADAAVCCVQTWGGCPSWEAIKTTPHWCR
ncbi:hypothetical protein J7M22_05540 [Candidatus Poribacteria bacterium]|nr:hypothetical protein [Candidatus Poribacteria bacterium]